MVWYSTPRVLISTVLYLFRHEVIRTRVTRPLFCAAVYCPLLLYLQTFSQQTLKNLASYTQVLTLQITKQHKTEAVILYCLTLGCIIKGKFSVIPSFLSLYFFTAKRWIGFSSLVRCDLEHDLLTYNMNEKTKQKQQNKNKTKF